jgi:hypothetical protein
MPSKSGLWIAIGGGRYAEKISYAIDNLGQFTTTVVTADVRPRPSELAVVSLHGTEADYIGISQAGRLLVTGQTTIAISNLVPIEDLSREKLHGRLSRRFASKFNPPRSGPYRISPALWQDVLRVIGATSVRLRRRLQDLERMAEEAQRPPRRTEEGLEIFERDAVASAIQAWAGHSFRKRVLREAAAAGQVPVASFLSRLQEVSVREDLQIIHDQSTFPGMEVARRDVVGSVVLRNGEQYLTILNCNRQPLEHTLGVDLIYYNHQFDSFVLVQYKRMIGGGSLGPEYRPQNDPNHDKELRRMLAAEKMLGALPRITNHDTDAYRLSERAFYVKLCETKTKVALDAGMVSGMYLPLALWRRVLKSPVVRGPRGGIVIRWGNCPRRFNNGEFTNLLRNGWIGSAARQSKALANIIENVLKSGRMLVLAATSESQEARDLRRDTLGRFAADDDPTAAI